jgi:HSP20 family molecular chaperone IbpA
MKRDRRARDNSGIEDLLDTWMEMISLASQVDSMGSNLVRQPTVAKPKHEGTMSYEDRDKDIVFTIDMPGVQKKDIEISVEPNSISVRAENGGSRRYNYSRKFRPTVDVDSAKATFTNGVLDITLNKVEAKPTGKIVKIK